KKRDRNRKRRKKKQKKKEFWSCFVSSSFLWSSLESLSLSSCFLAALRSRKSRSVITCMTFGREANPNGGRLLTSCRTCWPIRKRITRRKRANNCQISF